MHHPFRLLLCGACVMVAAAGLASPTAAAPPSLPETAAGRQLGAFLKVVETRDAAAVRAFVERQFAPSVLEQIPAERHVEVALRIATDLGRYTVRKADALGENEVRAVLVSELTEEQFQFTLRVEPEPPHRIVAVGIRPAPLPDEGAPARKRADHEVAAELESFLKRLGDADRFSGAVLLAKDGKPFFKAAYGLASRAWNAPNRTDTKFNLGSMNKMFTAVAVAQLAEQGKLSFQDPVGKHLPDYPNRDVREKVTIHHLLTHTSGLGSYFNEKFMLSAKERYRTVQDFLPLFADERLAFAPGARWEYSNAGFLLLGAVIEKVSGRSYFDYVRERIYQPAGMLNTDAYEMDRDTPNLATGYTRGGAGGPDGGGPRNNLFLHVVKGGPAGGGFSTVEDLLRFDQALRGHRLLGPDQTRNLLEGKIAAPTGRYAYGFFDQRLGGQRVVGHSGGFPGISANLDMYLDSGYTVAVMANIDDGSQPVVAKVRRLLAGR